MAASVSCLVASENMFEIFHIVFFVLVQLDVPGVEMLITVAGLVQCCTLWVRPSAPSLLGWQTRTPSCFCCSSPSP